MHKTICKNVMKIYIMRIKSPGEVDLFTENDIMKIYLKRVSREKQQIIKATGYCP